MFMFFINSLYTVIQFLRFFLYIHITFVCAPKNTNEIFHYQTQASTFAQSCLNFHSTNVIFIPIKRKATTLNYILLIFLSTEHMNYCKHKLYVHIKVFLLHLNDNNVQSYFEHTLSL